MTLKNVLWGLLISSVAFCPIASAECRVTGFVGQPVCDVSFYKLVGNAAQFSKKVIKVHGYYGVHVLSGQKVRLLFITDAAEFSGDYGAALVIDSLSPTVPKERRDLYERMLMKPSQPLILVGMLISGPTRLPNGQMALGRLAPVFGVNPVVPPPRDKR